MMQSETLFQISEMIRDSHFSNFIYEGKQGALLSRAVASFDPSVSVYLPCRMVFVSEYRFVEGFLHRSSGRAFYDIFYVKSGCLRYSASGTTERVPAGCVLFLNAKNKYTIEKIGEDALDFLMLRQYGFLTESFYRLLTNDRQPQPIPIASEALFLALFAKIKNYLTYPSARSNVLVTDTVSRFFSLLFLSNTEAAPAKNDMIDDISHPEWFIRTTKYLEKNISKRITAAELAENAEISESVFYRRFKAYTGTTPAEYINTVRLRHAEQLLYCREMPIKAVALSCGFFSTSYFIRQFLRFYGMTPGQYRQGIGLS